jgi:hypothetical protein
VIVEAGFGFFRWHWPDRVWLPKKKVTKVPKKKHKNINFIWLYQFQNVDDRDRQPKVFILAPSQVTTIEQIRQ